MKETVTNPSTSAGILNKRQLQLLDEFTEAAQRLNEAGVSLVWDEESNGICAANRDMMKDNSFFRLDPDEELPEGAIRLSETASATIGIEIHHMSEDYDLFYYPAQAQNT